MPPTITDAAVADAAATLCLSEADDAADTDAEGAEFLRVAAHMFRTAARHVRDGAANELTNAVLDFAERVRASYEEETP